MIDPVTHSVEREGRPIDLTPKEFALLEYLLYHPNQVVTREMIEQHIWNYDFECASKWWRTRDQGDSLTVAQHLADIVGIDYYPRHALATVGTRTLYLDGSERPWQQRRRKQLFARTRTHGQKLILGSRVLDSAQAIR